jgi:chemotaxis signal transduction protein
MAGARFLAVELDGQALLLEVHLIREVIGPCDAMEIPHQSGELDGIFLWNGKAIPLVSLGNIGDFRQRGASVSRSARRRKRTLIFYAAGEWAGLAVDDATDIVELEPSQLMPVRHDPGPYTIHEVDDGQTVRPVIDLTALVSHVLELDSDTQPAHPQLGGAE